ncbi:sensor histidine kinase [Sinomicrobium sp. M5D2P17]
MRNVALNEDAEKLHFVEILIQRKYRVYRHAIGIVLLFVMFISLQPIEKYNIYDLFVTHLITLSIFYINLYVLLPTLLYKRKYFTYLMLILLLLLLSLIFLKTIHKLFEVPNDLGVNKVEPSFLVQFLAYTAILTPFIFVSTGVKLFQKWIKYDRRVKELEKNTVEMELQALRNQINPHFVFNTLNNLNYMIVKDQKKASFILSRLSDFLSHHLYESNRKYIALASEIRFINDHLDLEQIRRDDFTFEVIPPQETDIEIPTNIFSVFVENAIKHSLDSDSASSVSVSFKRSGDLLTFDCMNTKPSNPLKKNTNGVGLKNVKRRLELIYADHYNLTIMNSDSIYKVTLTLPL